MTVDETRSTAPAGRPQTTGREPVERTNEWSTPAPRMHDITHVHVDHDPRAWHWFARGPLVVTDGGRRDDDDADRHERDVEDEQLRDVSHVPAHGEGAKRVWERGDEDEGQ